MFLIEMNGLFQLSKERADLSMASFTGYIRGSVILFILEDLVKAPLIGLYYEGKKGYIVLLGYIMQQRIALPIWHIYVSTGFNQQVKSSSFAV